MLEAGRVTEQGLYSELVRHPLPFLALSHLLIRSILRSLVQSTSENSRFRHLMAAQLALERKSPTPSKPVDAPSPEPAEAEVIVEGEKTELQESAEETERSRKTASGVL